MDKLKISRTAFTRAYGVFQAERAKESPNITSLQACFALIRNKASELDDLSLKLRNLMIEAEETEEAINKEVEHADEHTMKYYLAKVELMQLTGKKEEHVSPSPIPFRRPLPLNVPTQESIRTLKLPKIELNKFGGDIKDWLPFWNTFKKIHDDEALSREDEFHYLIQSTVKDSRAFEIVNSFPPTADNYEKAIQSLKSRFGKKDLLIEFYMRELLKLVLSKNKNVSLMAIYDKLETHLRALESLGITTDMCAAMLFPLVSSAFSYGLLGLEP